MSSAAPIAKPVAGVSSAVARADAWRRNLPNALTVLRLVMAAAFFVMLSIWPGVQHRGNPSEGSIDRTLLAAGCLFIVAALTDALDGHLSRRWRVTSAFGRVMDPFADKVLVVGAFVFLASPLFRSPELHHGRIFHVSGVEPWMVVVILSRELLVTSIRGLVEANGQSFAASASGKLKMLVQSITIPTVILANALLDVTPGTPGRWLIQAVVWITIAVTAVSGWPYVLRGIAALRDSEPAA